LEEMIGERLQALNLKLALAESCTGGLIGHRITNIPGSSNYYMGSVTAYAYEAKARILGVEWATLENFGAVSRETALEMAEGVRRALRADIGVSITGIAGPGGETPQKPVGLTWIGLSAEGHLDAHSYLWPGTRIQVKEQSAEAALRLLDQYLRSLSDGTP
jgi:nicotinamide-nucleotide amidase